MRALSSLPAQPVSQADLLACVSPLAAVPLSYDTDPVQSVPGTVVYLSGGAALIYPTNSLDTFTVVGLVVYYLNPPAQVVDWIALPAPFTMDQSGQVLNLEISLIVGRQPTE